jgi:hypothetical protein
MSVSAVGVSRLSKCVSVGPETQDRRSHRDGQLGKAKGVGGSGDLLLDTSWRYLTFRKTVAEHPFNKERVQISAAGRFH